MVLATPSCPQRIQGSAGSSMFGGRALQAFQSTARALRGSLLPSTGLGRSQWAAAPAPGRAFSAVRTKAASSSDDKTVASKKAQAMALEKAIKDINDRCGSGTIMHFGPGQELEQRVTSPTGALTLDHALGGGYPEGRLIEIFGAESTGKSTLAMHAMAEVQKKGGRACLIDAESAFDTTFARKLGMKLDKEAFYYVQPTSGEDVFFVLDKIICSECFDLICIDSVAAMVPRAELDGDVGAPQIGLQARLMSQGLRKITPLCNKHKTTVIFLNQIRNKIVVYGNPETTTGGMALRFYASARLKLSRTKQGAPTTDAQGEERGIRVLAKVIKNKCAPPLKTAEFDILWASGISSLGCVLDVAEKVGIVSKRGSWYSYNNENLAQGREKVLLLLQDNQELASNIEAETRAKISNPDVGVLVDTHKSMDEDDDENDEEYKKFVEAEEARGGQEV